MELRTITEVTKQFAVSTRTLRYYEQIGLLESRRMEGYSYRVYTEETCQRINQIIILRKLRIPLKQITVLLTDSNAIHAVELLQSNIVELEHEIDSLSTIRSILERFVTELQTQSGISLKSDLLNDTTLLSLISPLSIETLKVKEDKTMDDLNKANEQLNKLTDREVRIVYLPPATVASYQYVGDEPEAKVNTVVDKFVRESNLAQIKPDLRHYGFNAPNPVDGSDYHGYEMWVTIPDDFKVPEPLVKKTFSGGLYAAYMIPFGAFEEWGRFYEWVQYNEVYEFDAKGDGDNMFGCLEEHLNYVNHIKLTNSEPEGMQLDLLIPIKEKATK